MLNRCCCCFLEQRTFTRIAPVHTAVHVSMGIWDLPLAGEANVKLLMSHFSG